VIEVDVETGAGSWVLMLMRWYPPGVIAASLIAYVATKSRIQDEGRFERGVWFLGLVAPYAILLVYLLVGFEVPWLDDNLEDSIQELGQGAIVLQIAIAYFLSGGGGGG